MQENNQQDTGEKLLNAKEAAKFCGVSYATIWRELKKKNSKLKFYKIGGCKRFSPSRHLLPFLQSTESN
ncbi:MAG TPA: helix-turn-helix domain-containing protein [Pyrinomonadaceae bacterium]|jgi:predicted DNA-binding transcriptional regulator AlpA